MSTQRHDGTKDSSLSLTDARGPWTVANALTLLRIGLTVPFLYFISQGRFGIALTVFFLAGLTDFADGYVARKFKQESRLGRFLDPIADKLLTTAAFIAMAVPHAGFPSIPVWIAGLVVGRDLVIVLGSVVIYRLTKFKDFKPTFLGKANTLGELGLIFFFLLFHSTGRLVFLLPWLYAIVIACVLLSGGEYVFLGITILKQHNETHLR